MTRPPKGIVAFWIAVIAVFGGGAAYLQYLGPPSPLPPPRLAAGEAATPPGVTTKPAPAKPDPAKPASANPDLAKPDPAKPAPKPIAATGASVASANAPGTPIPPPDPALLAPSVENPGWLEPEPAADGRTPMRLYAAGAPAVPPGMPRVAIMVGGIGYNRDLSLAAIQDLPAAVSLAFSPYGEHLADAAAAARAEGHETLMGVPLADTPVATIAATETDTTGGAGTAALVPGAPESQNLRALEWSLAQAEGYAGVTDALGGTDDSDFLANQAASSWLMQQISDHGLFFVDSRPADPQPHYAWSRVATVVMDPVTYPQAIGVQLQLLLAAARRDGVALGVLTDPAPDAVKSLADWCNALATQGIALVPVSATVMAPDQAPPPTKGP